MAIEVDEQENSLVQIKPLILSDPHVLLILTNLSKRLDIFR